MKKKKIFKILGILVLVVVVAVIAIGGYLYTKRNEIARTLIVKIASNVLQVDVSLESVSIRPLTGVVILNNLVVGNPEGFKTDEAFSLGQITIDLNMSSLKSDVIHIELIHIKDPSVTLEQGLRSSNLSKLAENAQGEEAEEEAKPEQEPEESSKKVVIDKMVMEGTSVGVSAPILQGKAVRIPIQKLEIDDFGENPITIADAMVIFLSSLLKAIVDAGKGVLPDDLLGTLGDGLNSIYKSTGKVVGETTDFTKKTLNQASEATKSAVEATGEAAKSITEGVQNLFKKEKDEEEPTKE